VNEANAPDLAVRLIRTRDDRDHPPEEKAGLVPHVVEIIATIANLGDGVAGETITLFRLRGSGVERVLRLVHTPELLPGDEVEVTALWDLRDGSGEYAITVSADAFSQIAEARTDNNSATVDVTVVGTRVDLG
jgi:hypothetical protein